MAVGERRIDRGKRLAARALTGIGDELREARLRAGLSQRSVAGAAGLSRAELSRVERGVAPRVPYQTIVLVGAALGVDVPLRAFPSGDPVRDAAQLALLTRFRLLLPRSLRWQTEIPVRQPGDRRAWDAVVSSGSGTWRIPVDAESRLRDVQALSRSKALKLRDDGGGPMVLLVADTRHNRHVLRLARADLASSFPIAGREVLRALVAGRMPVGSGIVLL
jgi:transcriptional regulator with XRE-family HTH domain